MTDGRAAPRKLAIAAFIVPYIFAFSPVLLLLGDDVTAFTVILNTGTALVGVFGLQCALTSMLFGYHLNPLVRLAFAAGGLCMMIPGTATDIAGLMVIVGLCGIPDDACAQAQRATATMTRTTAPTCRPVPAEATA